MIKIKTKEEHIAALAKVEKWMRNQSRPLPANFDELVDAIVEYEGKHFKI
jgi:hypothetical protein